MRLAIMDTNVFNTIIAAVKGAVSMSARKPMYQNIRLEFRKKNKAVTAIATDGFRLFVEHATCCEVEEDFDCYIKPSIRLPRGNSIRLELKERDKTESVVEIADIPYRRECRVSSLGVAGGKVQRWRRLQAACYSGIPWANWTHYDQDQPRGRQNGPANANQGGRRWH